MKLLLFPHSHYCEKARWALDYKGVPFQVVTILPGFHLVTVRRYARSTSVPVILDGDKAVQGSSEIIDYLEEKYPLNGLTPSDPAERNKCLEFENMADGEIGQPLRQILYSGLLAYSDFICDCFSHSMPGYKRIVLKLIYPLLQKKIYQAYVISEENVAIGRRKLDRAMDTLEEVLVQREYLVGDRFSRADLSVASMLSILVMPEEHPFPWKDKEIPDPQTRIFCDEYAKHPVSEWVRQMYREYRQSGG